MASLTQEIYTNTRADIQKVTGNWMEFRSGVANSHVAKSSLSHLDGVGSGRSRHPGINGEDEHSYWRKALWVVVI
jgi:hypothetical protein